MVINSIVALARMASTPKGKSDYEKDGLLHCGECHTRREMPLEVFGGSVVVPVMCECRMKAEDELKEIEALRKAQRRQDKMRQEGISDLRWHSATFDVDDERDPNASKVCRNYAEHFDQMADSNSGLLLYGDVGTGKTFLAACIANAVLCRGKSVAMASLPTLIAQMGADYGDGRQEILDNIKRVSLLILDDVGVERSTEYSTEQAYEIINARYKSGKPLIVTTNLSLSALKGDLSLGRGRINDRLIELCIPVCVSGKSRRAEISNAKRQAVIDLLGAK